jgi:acetylornithine deacetylase
MTEYSRAIKHLRDYVAIPSVNPMGREDIPGAIAGESRLALHIESELRKLGVDALRVGEGDRQSVVAEIRCAEPGADTVLVASHIDTVPVDHMEIEPFAPDVVEGRLFGRGSCDTKGGMAALVAALERVLPGGGLRRHVVVVGEADEELSSLGVRDVLAHLGGRRPDWMLATEPTGLEIVHAHKGVVHVRLEAEGDAGHASEPVGRRNAVIELARAAIALADLGLTLQEERGDPLLGAATISVGRFGGGQAPNIVPDAAFLVADRRSLPGETLASIRGEIEGVLVKSGCEGVRIADCTLEKPALGTPADHPSVGHCRSALRRIGQAEATGTVAFGTDAGVFSEAGIPGVVMGPGSIEQAHTHREWVETAQVDAMADFFEQLLRTPG